MAPVASATANVAPTIASARTETRQPSKGAAAAGPAPNLSPAFPSSTPARSQSKDVSDTQLSASYNTAPDGRVRNPVPSKLKGMADNRNGNFGVMHMDLTKPETSARDAAAKRISESTAAAAQRANRNGYQSVKRSQLAWRPSDSLSPQTPAQPQIQLPPSASSTPQGSFQYPPPAQAPATPSAPAQLPPVAEPPAQPLPAPAASGLPSHVTKSEQARLLTLLRSLHPVLVVDQLCKALAYFGGIPGAPPPADGKFPESAAVNGSGSLFVGWLAEIFPPVDDNGSHGVFSTPSGHPSSGFPNTELTTEATNIPSTTDPAAPPVKRSRGRPKGSKSSKVRKDKGVKKKGSKNATNELLPEAQNGLQAAGTNEAHSYTEYSNQQSFAPDLVDSDATPLISSQPRNPTFSELQATPDTGNTTTPGSKKRGRPKGSKNRPKAAASDTPTDPSTNAPLPMPSTSNHAQSSPLAQKPGSGHLSAQSRPQSGLGITGSAAFAMQRDDRLSQQDSNSSPSSFNLFNTMGNQQADSVPIAAVGKAHNGPAGDTQGENGVRKRKAGQHATAAEQDPRTSGTIPATHEIRHPLGNPGEAASPVRLSQAKRRRMSKETNQVRVHAGPDVTTPGAQPLSPSNPNGSFAGSIQSMSTTTSFGSPKPAERLPAVRTTARFGPNQRLQRQQQQKAQAQPQQNIEANNASRALTQQQSPTLARAPQLSHPTQNGSGEMPSNAQARQQPNFYNAAQASRSPQTFYAQQRQPTTQYGHISNTGSNYGIGLPNSHPSSHFPQGLPKHNSNEAGMPESGPQGVAASARGKQTPDGARRPDYANQQSPRHPSGTSTQFPNYGDGGYLNMDYVMSGQNATNTANAAVAAFGGGSPLDETLAESGMRNRIY